MPLLTPAHGPGTRRCDRPDRAVSHGRRRPSPFTRRRARHARRRSPRSGCRTSRRTRRSPSDPPPPHDPAEQTQVREAVHAAVEHEQDVRGAAGGGGEGVRGVRRDRQEVPLSEDGHLLTHQHPQGSVEHEEQLRRPGVEVSRCSHRSLCEGRAVAREPSVGVTGLAEQTHGAARVDAGLRVGVTGEEGAERGGRVLGHEHDSTTVYAHPQGHLGLGTLGQYRSVPTALRSGSPLWSRAPAHSARAADPCERRFPHRPRLLEWDGWPPHRAAPPGRPRAGPGGNGTFLPHGGFT